MTYGRRFPLGSPPPEAGFSEFVLLVTALVLGGLAAGGVARYVLFGLAWLLVVIVCREVLSALFALTVSASAIVGFFGVRPEDFLTFLALALAAGVALAAAVAAVISCAAILRSFWHRIPRGLSNRRRRRRVPILRVSIARTTPIDRQHLLSPSQYIVSLAVCRLPESMSDEERERWEEEMRGDVESKFFFFRILYASGIWLRGAPAMPNGMDDAPQDKPSRG